MKLSLCPKSEDQWFGIEPLIHYCAGVTCCETDDAEWQKGLLAVYERLPLSAPPPPPPPPQQQILPLLSLSESVSCSSTFAESKQYQIVWLFKLDVEWDDVLTPLNETTPHFYSISCWRASCHPLWESALKAGVLSDTLSTCCLNQRYGNM